MGSWGSRAGLARVARAADGWLASAYNTTPERFASARADLARALAERGREADGFPNALATMWTWVSEDGARPIAYCASAGAAPPSRSRRAALAGLRRSAGHCAELLARYAEAGCGRVYVWPLGDEPRQLELIAAAWEGDRRGGPHRSPDRG